MSSPPINQSAAATRSTGAVVEFTIGAERFRLGRLFTDVSDVQIKLTELVPVTTELVPYLWLESDEETFPRVEDAIAAEPHVNEFALVTDHGSRRLYRIEWVPALDGLFDAIRKTGLAMDHAVGTDDHWEFRVFSSDYADFSDFRRVLEEHDLSVSIQCVHTLSHNPRAITPDPTIDLTTKQREALVTAFEQGYFEIPRQATLDELAADLEISRQAVSYRLQRAFTTLIESTVINVPED